MSNWTTTLPDYIRVGNNWRTKTGRETDLGGPENKTYYSSNNSLSCENVSNWTFRFGSKLKAPKHVFLGGEVVATMSYDNDLRTILEAL